MSGNSWANMGQECIKCHINVYPHKQVSRARGGGGERVSRTRGGGAGAGEAEGPGEGELFPY